VQELCPELLAVGAVDNPLPCCGNPLAGRDRGGVADNGDQVAVPASLRTQDAEAIVRIVESDALDQAGQHFAGGYIGLLPHPLVN
jgi:hypothetical protein